MAKRERHRVLMLVPTDNEASNPGRLDGCMLPLFVDLIKYGPEMEAADYDKLPEHLRRLVSRSEAGELHACCWMGCRCHSAALAWRGQTAHLGQLTLGML